MSGRFDDRWGEPVWRVECEPAADPPPASCDVAIVGAGFTGLAAARALAAGGARVAVLEAGAVGRGASGRTGGLVLEGTHAGPLPGMDRCIAHLEASVKALGIDCGLELPGCREVAHRPLHEEGSGPIRWRDGEQSVVAVGLVAGGVVDPGRLLAGLARAARDAGASLHEGSQVTPIRVGRAEPLVLETPRRAVQAGAVLLATNAWSGALSRDLPIGAALTFALCTEPLARGTLAEIGFDPPLPFYTADQPYLWGRAVGADRLLVGSGLVFAAPDQLDGLRIANGEARERMLRLEARVRGLHPALAAVRIAQRWAGPIGILWPRPPILARLPSDPRVLVAGGYSGHGVAASVSAGELVARALLDGTPLPAWGGLDA